MPNPHALYRFYDETGKLLYVGISVNPGARFAQHRSDKPWWAQIVDIKVQPMPSRGAALAAEREAIKNERPSYNTIHNQRTEKADPSVAICRSLDAIDEFVVKRICKVLGDNAIGPVLLDRMIWSVVPDHYSAYADARDSGCTEDEAVDAANRAADRSANAELVRYLEERAVPREVSATHADECPF